jgi:hypothetical protein
MLGFQRRLKGNTFINTERKQMTTRDTLYALVSSGSDLTLFRKVPRDVIFELARLAQKSGAKLTVRADYPSDVVLSLAHQYGKSIAFIEGLADFEKR